jgi:Raf kinase inhibitor-like YbhB/YbcL family protein
MEKHVKISASFPHFLAALVLAAATTTAANAQTLRQPGTPANLPKLTVTSHAFANGAAQPKNAGFAACGGSNTSPDLSWSGAPANTKSFVITEFDPDAPTGVGFWHWTVVNIPASVTSLAAGAALPSGAIAGLTDYGLAGYQGPCPPVGDGPHHYKFTVSALDIPVVEGVTAGATGAYVTFSIRGHILAQGTYVGTYAR